MIRIGVLGATGKMGRWVSRLIETEFGDKATVLATAHQGDNLQYLLEADAVIDFSRPSAMAELARLACGPQPASLPIFVSGSTGWTREEMEPVDELAKKAAVLVSANFSTGVYALHEILRQSAPLLRRLGYNPVITEAHHRHKKDAPSGTAIWLQKAVAPDNPSAIQTHSIRAGEVIGDHEVTFFGVADKLSFGHFAQDRSIFARGAVQVALWLASLPPTARPSGRVLGMNDYFSAIQRTAEV